MALTAYAISMRPWLYRINDNGRYLLICSLYQNIFVIRYIGCMRVKLFVISNDKRTYLTITKALFALCSVEQLVWIKTGKKHRAWCYRCHLYFAQSANSNKFDSIIDVLPYRFYHRADNISIPDNRGILMSTLCLLHLH